MSLDFITEMAWKSVAISGVALLILLLLRSRSAADRAAVVRLAVVMLLLLPIVSLALPALQVERPEASVVEMPVYEPVTDAIEDAVMPPVVSAHAHPPSASVSPQPGLEIPTAVWLSGAYVLGLAMLVARLLAGLWTLRRWTAAGEPVRSVEWHGALRRAVALAGIDQPVQLRASDDVRSPLSWGLKRPTILVDFDTLARTADADAVLAHEMAHIVRRDWAMLMLSRVAVAIFWFNPLVWLLERALVEHAEEAADLRAVGGVEPASYARTLVACSAQAAGMPMPANSMAGGRGLARRVRAVLDDKRRQVPSGSAWTAVAMLACAAVSVPIAALELVAPTPPVAPAAPQAPAAPRVAVAPVKPVAPATPKVPAAPPSPGAPDATAAPEPFDVAAFEAEVEAAADSAPSEAEIARIEAAAETAAERGERAAARAAAVAVKLAARAEASAAAAVGRIDVDELIEMKVHGIDARYLAELAAAAPRRLSVDDVVQTKIHGLTPARLRQFADAGYGNVDIDDLVAMQIHGVTPAFIRDMAAAGYSGLEPDDLVAMRIHGVTPDFARRACARGPRPSPEELVEMRILGKI